MVGKPARVNIIEVGPRDGLQNVGEVLTIEQKEAFIQYLLDRGFIDIEAGSFVRPDKVPSMADTPQIATHFKKDADKLWYLVPNQKGLEAALKCGVTQAAFFTAASETFNRKNIGMTTAESLKVIRDAVCSLKDRGFHLITEWSQKPCGAKEIKLRLYISTVIGCPYDGAMSSGSTIKIMDELLPLGFAQVSLGDTLGVGKPNDWKNLLKTVDSQLIKENRIAMHCHDTFKRAISCVREGLEWGVQSFDSSMGGLGGCPFAPGAKGNLATEDLLLFLQKEGIETGIDLKSLLDAFSPTRTGALKNVSKVAHKVYVDHSL